MFKVKICVDLPAFAVIKEFSAQFCKPGANGPQNKKIVSNTNAVVLIGKCRLFIGFFL